MCVCVCVCVCYRLIVGCFPAVRASVITVQTPSPSADKTLPPWSFSLSLSLSLSLSVCLPLSTSLLGVSLSLSSRLSHFWHSGLSLSFNLLTPALTLHLSRDTPSLPLPVCISLGTLSSLMSDGLIRRNLLYMLFSFWSKPCHLKDMLI